MKPWEINAELCMTPEVASAIADGRVLPQLLVDALKDAISHHRETGRPGRVLVLLPDEVLEEVEV